MSRHYKIAYITPPLPIRKLLQEIYTTWDAACKEHLGRTGTWMPPEVRSDTKKIERESLPGLICRWAEFLGVEEATEVWQQFLQRVPNNEFLKKGWGSLKPPTLFWLFASFGKGRGINRVLGDEFNETFKGGHRFATDEGE